MAADTAPVSQAVPTTPAATAEGLSSVEQAIAAIAAGRPVIVADDEHRENEGDVVLSAELATPEWIAWTVAHSSGFICAPVSAEIADALDLPPMVEHNEDVRGTAYTVTVDAAVGVTTGISAHDRARTLRVLADPTSVRDDLHRPGHVVPLRARSGGVRERAGHTEAAIDLVTAAGLRPAAAICEIVDEQGGMMRLPELVGLGTREGVPVITIAALASWLDAADRAADVARTEGTHA
jgi:3,4-dihydroxy-2-butanone 4-phosphate synthase